VRQEQVRPEQVSGGGRRAVGRFDRAVDEAFDRHLRNRPAIDRIMYGASALGDHGILWLLIAGAQQARRRAAGDRSWRLFGRGVAGVSIESALVNGPVKWLFRRSRPVIEGPRPHHLRQPRTSSFPSGHATSAFCAAALLRDGDPLWPLYYVLAVVVASSRVYVRIHHASDVVGGVIIGVALGELGRHVVPPREPCHARPGPGLVEPGLVEPGLAQPGLAQPGLAGAAHAGAAHAGAAHAGAALARSGPPAARNRTAGAMVVPGHDHLVRRDMGLPLPLRPQRP